MNLRRIAGAMLRKWWMIALVTIVVALAGWGMASSSPPVYEAVVTLYSMDLSKLQEEGAQLEYYDIELSREVLEQFSDVIYTRRVTAVVQEQLVAYELTEETLLSMVTIENSIDANIFYIKAKSDDPELSADVANAMATQFAITIHELLNTENVGILDEANVPEKPEPKNAMAMAFLGTVAGFILGFSIVYLLEYFDPKVYSLEDFDEKFGMRVWGAVPKQKNQNPNHPSVRKAYDLMVANMQASGKKDHRLRSILITSCNPKEGKTSIATGLAMNNGKVGLNTLLMDGHFEKPQGNSLDNPPSPAGWVEFLEGKIALEDVLVKLDENVVFLPSGDPGEHQTKWLMSKEFEAMMGRLAKDYDVVLIDGPSLEEGADSFMLSSVAGHVLLVASKGVSSIKQIQQAKARVESSGAQLLGVILNKTKK